MPICDLPAVLDHESPPGFSENRLYRFEVSFTGPPMIRRTRGALSAAAITPLVDSHANAAYPCGTVRASCTSSSFRCGRGTPIKPSSGPALRCRREGLMPDSQ